MESKLCGTFQTGVPGNEAMMWTISNYVKEIPVCAFLFFWGAGLKQTGTNPSELTVHSFYSLLHI